MEDTNRLIAEFMGMNIVTLDDIRSNKNPMISSADGYTVDSLQYHTSWDWLMPVVEEIDHLQFEEVVEIETGLKMRSLSATYNAVVEFIKQHNKNK